MGLIKNEKISISKKPMRLAFDSLFKKGSIHSSTHIQSEDSKYDIEDEELSKKWFNASVDGTTIVIDPETGEPIQREVYFDEAESMWKARIRLTPYRSYFAFKIMQNAEDSSHVEKRKMSNLEIGKYYRFGVYSFCYDPIKAVKYLEKDASPEALYHIACILLTDDTFSNEELGLNYLRESSSAGYPPAKVELAEYLYFNSDDTQSNADECLALLLSAVDDGYAPAQFLYAYVMEKGIFVTHDMNASFEMYYKAACDSNVTYYPALLRLSNKQPFNLSSDKETMRECFVSSFNEDNAFSTYCLGLALRLKLYEHEEEHLGYYPCLNEYWQIINFKHFYKVLVKAFNDGCIEAQYEIASYFDEFIDASSSLEECRLLTDFSAVACMKCVEKIKILYPDDKSYDDEILQLLNKAINLYDAVLQTPETACELYSDKWASPERKGVRNALYMLGESYMHGTLCECDMKKAQDYLTKAVSMGESQAYYLLGKMHEEGFLADKESDYGTAIDMYREGADRGCMECIRRLEELGLIEKDIEKTEDDSDMFENMNSTSDTNNLDAALSEINDNLNILSQKLDSVHGQVTEVNERTISISEQLSDLTSFAKSDLSSEIANAKKLLSDKVRLSETDISNLIAQISGYINSHVSGSELLIESEQKYLSLLLGEAWDSLLDTSRTSLISAGVLWKTCENINEKEFDFSGVCISATSAFEAEMKRYFFTGFQEYLTRKYGAPDPANYADTFANWPEVLLSTSQYKFSGELLSYNRDPRRNPYPDLKVGETFTLGSIPYIFGVRFNKFDSVTQRQLLKNKLTEYLQSIIKDSDNPDPISIFTSSQNDQSFVDLCENIRKNYRNKAAHVEIVSKIQAKNCYHKVIGAISEDDTSLKIISAISRLYSILK